MSEIAHDPNRRYHDLDFVRAAAMLFGVVLHVSMFFMPTDMIYWGAGEYAGDEVSRQFLSTIHLFRMQLFFLMAGFFAQLVIDRKGFRYLLGDRGKRIVLPFLAGILIVMPFHVFLMNGVSIGNIGGSYYNTVFTEMGFPEQLRAVFLFGAFDDVPGLDDSLIHYWFLYYLLFFYAAHFLLRPVFLALGITRIPGLAGVMRLTAGRRLGFVVLAILGFPFQYLLVDIMFWPSGFSVPLIDLTYYFVFYLFGVGLYVHRERLTDLARNAWFLIGLSLPLALLVAMPSSRIDWGAPIIKDLTTWEIFDPATTSFHLPVLHWDGIVHSGWDKVLMAFIRASLCWTIALGFIGLAHRYLDTPRAIVRYLADSAYWVYFIHLPVTCKLSMLAQQISWGSSLFKSFVVFVVSVVIIYWSYNTFVRYTWLGDFFMGRRKSRRDPEEAQFALPTLLRRAAPATATLGVSVFLLGAMLQYDRRESNDAALVEAYATRNQAIIDAATDVEEIRDVVGNTPLHHATKRFEANRNYDPMPLLIARAGHLDARNEFGRTALFVAVRYGNLGDVRLLLEGGADPNIPDRHGHTPAHVAAIKTAANEAYFLGILDVLIEYGADLDLLDTRGRTVTDCLVQFGGLDVATLDLASASG